MLDTQLAYEATKTIIEGLFKARSWKKSKNREYFDEIITPIYVKCKLVYNNYISIFDRLIEMLDDENNGISYCIKFLEDNRRAYQAIRVDIRALVQEMEKSSGFQNDQFFTGISALMKGGVSQREGGYVDYSKYGYKRHTILDFIHGMSQSEVPSSQANLYYQKEARQQIRCLENAWEDIAKGHAKIKHEVFS